MSVPFEDYEAWSIHIQAVDHSADRPTDATNATRKRKIEDSGFTQSRAASPKSQRRAGQGDVPSSAQVPDWLAAAGEATSGTLDLSLIDPIILGPALSDPALQTGDISTGSLLSPQSLDGSTACVIPITDHNFADTEEFETDAFTYHSILSPLVGPPGLGSSYACLSRSPTHVEGTHVVSEASTPCLPSRDNAAKAPSRVVLSGSPEAGENPGVDDVSGILMSSIV